MLIDNKLLERIGIRERADVEKIKRSTDHDIELIKKHVVAAIKAAEKNKAAMIDAVTADYSFLEHVDEDLETRVRYHYGDKKANEYTVNSDGQRHGLTQGWFYDGQRSLEENYVDGKKHGLVQYWYPDGKRRIKGEYVNGKKHGLYQRWYDHGSLGSEENWVNGKRVSYKGWNRHGNPTSSYSSSKL